jgi:hypothetical protein
MRPNPFLLNLKRGFNIQEHQRAYQKVAGFGKIIQPQHFEYQPRIIEKNLQYNQRKHQKQQANIHIRFIAVIGFMQINKRQNNALKNTSKDK